VEKNSYISNFKKLPKGFLLAFFAILVFEFSNLYFDNYLYNPERIHAGLTIKIKNEIAQSKDVNFDIIIFGDSHTHFGIKPQLIEDITGLSCFNFSLFSPQGIFGSYLIFKNYVKSHHKKPKYVIIGHVPFTMYPVAKPVLNNAGISSLIDLKKGNLKAFIEEFGLAQGIKFLMPSLKHQSHFKDLFKNPSTFVMSNNNLINDIVKQIYLNKGFHPKKKQFPVIEQIKMREYKRFFEDNDLNNFKISPFSYKYLIKILELAQENKIIPIYYIPALPPYVYKRLGKYTYMQQHDDLINYLKQDFPDLIIIRSQEVLNENDMYLDMYHLSEKGVIALSNFIAQEINILNKRLDERSFLYQ